MLKIKRFSPNHLDSLNKCFNTVFDSTELENYRKIKDFSLTFVGMDPNDNVKAFIIANKSESKFGEYEIAYLGISSEFRGRGYGKILLRLMMNELKGHCVWLNALVNNDIACKLYKEAGFIEMDRYIDNSGNNSIAFATVDCLK
uniref:N-acetyltransferase domain-containing protein n=1 Tax=viral metagenome TaxID=1070528 RepID=A0A6C0JXB4_9ZZZZ